MASMKQLEPIEAGLRNNIGDQPGENNMGYIVIKATKP